MSDYLGCSTNGCRITTEHLTCFSQGSSKRALEILIQRWTEGINSTLNRRYYFFEKKPFWNSDIVATRGEGVFGHILVITPKIYTRMREAPPTCFFFNLKLKHPPRQKKSGYAHAFENGKMLSITSILNGILDAKLSIWTKIVILNLVKCIL